jgi:hypothetical protein
MTALPGWATQGAAVAAGVLGVVFGHQIGPTGEEVIVATMGLVVVGVHAAESATVRARLGTVARATEAKAAVAVATAKAPVGPPSAPVALSDIQTTPGELHDLVQFLQASLRNATPTPAAGTAGTPAPAVP